MRVGGCVQGKSSLSISPIPPSSSKEGLIVRLRKAERKRRGRGGKKWRGGGEMGQEI